MSQSELDWEVARLCFQAATRAHKIHIAKTGHIHPQISQTMNAIHNRYRSGERSEALHTLMMAQKIIAED